MPIQEAQNHTDPTDADPEHCKKVDFYRFLTHATAFQFDAIQSYEFSQEPNEKKLK
jgi:hypothetical protein